ncbi:MAG: hypothetical protein DME80_08065, partial [Verrucomicrobia bacterium]
PYQEHRSQRTNRHMIPMPFRIILLLALQFTASPLSAASSWQEADPEQSNTRLGNGKTIQTVVSPNGAYTVLLRDEGEQQDFAWKRLYLKQGQSYTLIGVYNTIEDIRWDEDSTNVRFKATKAVGPDQVEEREATYDPRKKLLRWRVLRVIEIPT